MPSLSSNTPERTPKAPPTAPLIFFSAGEASGERYGVMLIGAVRARLPQAQFFGLGGTQMGAAGCERVVRAEEIAVLGFTEVVRHLPTIYGKYRLLLRSIVQRRPQLAVLIDFPEVNLRLARHLHRLGIPVIYFVSPQLWAWKQHRIRWVQRYVNKMLVIFPFEETYYRERGVDAKFVGHPLADVPLPTVSRAGFARLHGLDAAKDWIGLLPGSRKKELRLNLPEMAKAAVLLGPRYEYLLPAAATLEPEWVRQQVQASGQGAPIHVLPDARAVLYHARASVVASGTATVEAALMGNPFLVVYRLSRLSYAIASRMVQVPHVAMVNLIANQRIVPELVQREFTAESVVQHLQPLLHDGAARAAMQRELAAVRTALHLPAAEAPAVVQAMAASATGRAWQEMPETSIDRVADWALHFLQGAHSIQGKAQRTP
jgi:lipid-A-disaccharide synthase